MSSKLDLILIFDTVGVLQYRVKFSLARTPYYGVKARVYSILVSFTVIEWNHVLSGEGFGMMYQSIGIAARRKIANNQESITV